MHLDDEPVVRVVAATPADAKELRDYLLERSTIEEIITTITEAFLELQAMDHLEAFERCR